MGKQLTHLMRDSLSAYTTDGLKRKNKYHTSGRAALRAVARAMGLQAGQYDLRSNKGGMAVSGEVTLHTDKVYVQLSKSCIGPGHEILFRTCKGRRDYTGGHNHFADISELENPAEFAKTLLLLTAIEGA